MAKMVAQLADHNRLAGEKRAAVFFYDACKKLEG
jgi:hypothetical protein